MHRATGKRRYLQRAGRHVERILPELKDWRWIRLRTDDEEKVYVGRLNSMILQAVYNYVQASGRRKASLDKMARAFRFTDEGTWNHWQTAVIGHYTAARVRGEPVPNERLIRKQMQDLRSQIERHRGKIPYIMLESDPDYPDFRRTYQTLSTMLLAKMAARTELYVGVPSTYLWPLVWSEAIDAANTKTYWGNNCAAALHLLEGTRRRYDDWMRHQTTTATYTEPPTTFRKAISKLRGTSALALYWARRYGSAESSRNLLTKEARLRPNPVSGGVRFSFRMSRAGLVHISVYDMLGRRVKSSREVIRSSRLVQKRVHFGSLSSGKYTIVVRSGEESIVYRATVIQ